MAEYILRDQAIRAVTGAKMPDVSASGLPIANGKRSVTDCVRRLKEIHAADVRPVVRGKWTLNKDGSGTCSECGRTQHNCWDLDNWDNFCHFCGADMRPTQIKRKKTNADRIRAMTDEELAIGMKAKGGCPHDCEEPENMDTDCVKCWLGWLRQEEK